ncbi:MAG: hypothetical protein OHK0019_30920 [Saprospiraceae bacterium]
MEIILHAKHVPIKISYDTTFINASACHQNMILSPDWQIFLQEFWWDARVWYCMSNYDEIIDSSDYIVDPEESAGYLKYEFEVEGQGLKELGGYFWVVKWIGICQTLVGTEAGETEAATVKIFPNPAEDEISLELPKRVEAERIDFYDACGRTVKSLNAQSLFDASKIRVSDLPVGFYVAIVTRSDGQLPLMFKFVKQ